MNEIGKENEINNDLYWFKDAFMDEVDSWFSSDIACCDKCHDDFINLWPLAYNADEAEFQRSSIDLDCFYSGSRINQIYSKDKYDQYIETLYCPRCYNNFDITSIIWPYNLPFDVVDDFEFKVEEISLIAAKTPFLLLENDFAKSVLNAIIDLSKYCVKTRINQHLYRARSKSSLSSDKYSEFDFPPNKFVTEGRYNHNGCSTLYLGSDVETCYHEIREQACKLAEVDIFTELKLLDLTNAYDSHQSHHDLLNTLVYSTLISAMQNNEGWHKPEYVFSRFLSDCARYAGFDAIKYPSTRGGNQNFNIAILNNDLTLAKNANILRVIEYPIA